jgi:hypothetical protein
VSLTRPIPRLVAVLGILTYIRKRLRMSERTTTDTSSGPHESSVDVRARELEELLREDARRYEQDLRELAET